MKTYRATVKSPQGNFVGSLPLLVEPVFTRTINAGLGECSFKLVTPIDSQEYDNVLQLMNKVEIFAYDKEGRMGIKEYTGYINYIDRVSSNSEFIQIKCIGYSSLLSDVIYKSSTDVTIVKSSVAGNTIFKDIIDSYTTQHSNSPLNYGSNTVVTGVSNITDDYNSLNCKEALDRLMGQIGSSYYWYEDSSSVIHLKQKPNEAIHTFTYGANIIPPLETNENIDNLANQVLFYDGNSVSRLYVESDNQDTYFSRTVKHEDANLTATTAQTYAENYVAVYKEPNRGLMFKVIDSNASRLGYDIDIVEVGDTFNIRNFSGSQIINDNLQITSIKKYIDYIEIIAEDSRNLIEKEINKNQRNINKIFFEDGQPNYTQVNI